MTTTGALDDCLHRLRQTDGVLVQVVETRGSAPREAGTWMVVWPDALSATSGGGQLEIQATADQGHRGHEVGTGGAGILERRSALRHRTGRLQRDVRPRFKKREDSGVRVAVVGPRARLRDTRAVSGLPEMPF